MGLRATQFIFVCKLKKKLFLSFPLVRVVVPLGSRFLNSVHILFENNFIFLKFSVALQAVFEVWWRLVLVFFSLVWAVRHAACFGSAQTSGGSQGA